MGSAQDEPELSALFRPDQDMASLLRELEAIGLERDEVDVCSPLPLEEASVKPPFTWLPYWITIAAGAAGIGVGLFFSAGTALLYPIETGAKGIVAPPVVGIISYETMMLVAVVLTFLTMIVRIGRERGDRPRPAEVDDGMLLVEIRPAKRDLSRTAIRSVLERAGAVRILAQPSERPWFEPGVDPKGLPIRGLCWAGGLFAAALSACSPDMQEQPSYRAQEAPRLHSPQGSIPRESRVLVRRRGAGSGGGRLDGAELFRINCVHCHGPSGAGDGPVAGYLEELPANLQAPRVRRLSVEDLYRILTEGKDAMPSFRGELSADERWQLAKYIKEMRNEK
jgi:hypothetical protein